MKKFQNKNILSKRFDYELGDIISALKKCNIKNGDNVYVSGNLTNFGYCKTKDFEQTPKIFFKAIFKIIKNGTIIVPAHSFYLANTRKKFNLKKTKSISGSFSNFILNQKKVVRQIHPFSSSAAIGKNANFFCKKNTSNVYGPNSPFDKMIKKGTKFLSLGLPINLNCSQVHHAEYAMKVPYRYNKKFNQKIKIGNREFNKDFYMFVLKEKYLKIKRNKNKIIFNNFLKKEKLFKSKLGNNYIYSYSLSKFYKQNLNLLKKNIFCWVGKKLK